MPARRKALALRQSERAVQWESGCVPRNQALSLGLSQGAAKYSSNDADRVGAVASVALPGEELINIGDCQFAQNFTAQRRFDVQTHSVRVAVQGYFPLPAQEGLPLATDPGKRRPFAGHRELACLALSSDPLSASTESACRRSVPLPTDQLTNYIPLFRRQAEAPIFTEVRRGTSVDLAASDAEMSRRISGQQLLWLY